VVGRDFDGMRRGDVADWMGEGKVDEAVDEEAEAKVDATGAASWAGEDPAWCPGEEEEPPEELIAMGE